MSTLILLNPSASQARKKLTRIRGILADSDLLEGAEVEPCEGWEEGRRAARRAAEDGYRLVVAAGGDGTVNSVVNGLMAVPAPRPILAVLPLGTGNDLARSLAVPGDLDEGLEALTGGSVRALDVLKVELEDEIRYCANVSAGGFSGRVDEDLTDEAKERWGPVAYLMTALEQVTQVESFDVVLSADEGTREMSACNVVVANGRWAAGGIPVAPEAVMNDGLMDVVALASAPVAKLGVVAALMAAGRHLEHELVTTFRTKKLCVRSETPIRFNVDGELLGAGGAIGFEIVPGALRVLVGKDEGGAI